MQIKHFEHRSRMPGSVQALIDFHADPLALRKLMLPPTFIRVIRDDRQSLTEGELEFVLWLGPVPVHWLAEHTAGPTPTSFTDRMVTGPMAHWEHEHIFENAPDGVILHDRIAYAHQDGLRGLWTRLLFDGIPLRMLFWYRHWRTRQALT